MPPSPEKLAISLAAKVIAFVGVGVCGFGLLGAAAILLEGVTGWAGEGQLRQPETPAEVRTRLTFLGGFLAAGSAGWCLQRLTVSARERHGASCRSRLGVLVAEGLLFLGGVCLFLALLIAAGSFQAQWEVAAAYWWLAGGAAFTAPLLLLTGGLLRQRYEAGGSVTRQAAK
jgi:hypothetical protein